MLRILIELIDTLIFLALVVQGLMFVAERSGGYIPFWGCAFLCTAVYWKQFDKNIIIIRLKDAFNSRR